MDVEFPYADGTARLGLLYRLPSIPEPRRLLLVSDTAMGDLIARDWSGWVKTIRGSDIAGELELGGGRFDAVGLPCLMAPHAMSSRGSRWALQLLGAARELLAPGGVVVGHFENRCALRRYCSFRNFVPSLLSVARRDTLASAARCKEALFRCSFTDPECYFVQPNIDSPMGLIPSECWPARAQFLRSIRSTGPQGGAVTHVARLLVAWLGLGGMLQPQVFFWARKRC